MGAPDLWLFRAALVKITDGDSLTADLDLGFFLQLRVNIRLLGIDAPELNARDAETREAARRAKARLVELVPFEFLLRTHKASAAVDKYGGRWLGEVLLGDGRSAAEILVAEGLARAYDGGAR